MALLKPLLQLAGMTMAVSSFFFIMLCGAIIGQAILP
jgi:hypothetical protein